MGFVDWVVDGGLRNWRLNLERNRVKFWGNFLCFGFVFVGVLGLVVEKGERVKGRVEGSKW